MAERARTPIALGLLGAYVNAAAYGFRTHGVTNNAFELALTNWLRDRSLYPDDPLTHVFATYPSAFWPAVAFTSRYATTEHVLFVAFLLTKLLFFSALARLVAPAVPSRALRACIVVVCALSPILNQATELGCSDILNGFQTHTSLAIALLLWVGVLLTEERWIGAGLLAGLCVHINVLFVGFSGPGMAALALWDRRRHGRGILLGALVGALVALPWLLALRGPAAAPLPPSFVDTLLAQFPDIFTLRTHSLASLARGFATIAVGAGAIALAKHLALPRLARVELLAASYLLPLALGIAAGTVLPLPSLVRAQLSRADSFAVLYALVLAQIYGAQLLAHPPAGAVRAASWLGASALLLPLAGGWFPFALLGLGLVALLDPRRRFDRVTDRIAGSRITLSAGALAAAAALTGLLALGRRVTAGLVACVAPVLAALQPRRTPLALGLASAAALVLTLPGPRRLWNPFVPRDAHELAWREVQDWAKTHTPREARFMVPPASAGFRVYSERSSWVDWNDGITIDALPAYADEWWRRMSALGVPLRPLHHDLKEIAAAYRAQPWPRLHDLARAEHIDYIIQSCDVPYPVPPVFVNRDFAIYKAL